MRPEPEQDKVLPRGRHGIGREHVRAHQVGRIERALVDTVAGTTLESVTVATVVERARVSRQTFYEIYSSKEQCYERTVNGFAASLWGRTPQISQAADWPAFESALREIFEIMIREPSFSYCLVVQPPPNAHRSSSLREQVAPALRRLLSRDGFAVDAFAALIRQVVADHLILGCGRELPARSTELTALLQAYGRGISVAS